MDLRIKFIYDRDFDKLLHDLAEKWLNKKLPFGPKEKLLKVKDSLNRFWIGNKEKILKSLYELVGIEWKEKEIECYIISSFLFSWSIPMVIKYYHPKEPPDYYLGFVFLHELLHRYFWQDPEKHQKILKKLSERYKIDNKLTLKHILIYSVLIWLYKDILKREKDLKKFLEYEKENYGYEKYKLPITIAEREYKEILWIFKEI